jgi:hypothetical protein
MTTVSSLLAQVQAEATTNLDTITSVYAACLAEPAQNLPAGFEGQVLGGHFLFQQNVSAYLNSLPSSLTPVNDESPGLILTMEDLLATQQNLNNILNEIQTNNTYQQPVSLTILNVFLVLADAEILYDIAVAALAYSAFALEALIGNLVTVGGAGNYSVPIPSGATFVDIVLLGAGGGGGGYDAAGAGTGGNGGNTTATPEGGSELTAAGGVGGASTTGSANSAGGSPGNITFDNQPYNAGHGGAAGSNGPGGGGGAPGAGGGGGGSFGSYGGVGGTAGAWTTATIAIPSGMTTITGSVGAGGTPGASSDGATGGAGANGEAFFYFYKPGS